MKIIFSSIIFQFLTWGDDLEKRLRQLYVKENIVDIFWGRSLKDDDTIWSVYVVRNIPYLFKRTENVMEDQMIRFITEEEGSYGFGVGVCQVYQKDFELGSSIGIFESEGTSGTLSAVVRDKISDQIGILPCEHVCKFNESSTGTSIIIHQPSHKDLDNLLVGIASKNKAVICETTTTPKHTGIDAAYCTFTNTNRTLCTNKCSVLPEKFKKANLPGNTCINGFYKCEEFDNDIDDFDIFKVVRATGFTLGKLLPIGVAISIDLTNESIKIRKRARQNSYLKSIKALAVLSTVWFDQQLVFAFDFEPGDSGGFLHAAIAVWITEHFSTSD
ncbi:hypothetical protein GLOIN_2v1781436 [Rhizophagus irregularis DAOM 181602=DAOM 197198]|uniref:Uncharacterized protein n=1 Tax=Rhizophagus irregularis (strain DAOM 181602 / DAOM 197198 / MUCL 43194) TaxID=747089 RepID=A0A2P4PJZ6_RHIID|nr:hypothetical protein GLOIN_2v1781436 [Rhizophagus irregularis DAOM 181602=DAOM 197198]POG65688.1 hypothetical protein GLOIN_2v1781436 [Rhizophagus irregularis DAOM 181602=DAOM 197198]|eukprot:XP_025172554.1 hypothetical protein GLOIN_2v1781436 [Rhizophagus irregularis DAOM 181602=DAOM 197198]